MENFVLSDCPNPATSIGSSLSSRAFDTYPSLGATYPACCQCREQLLRSTFDTYPTVTVEVDGVTQVLQEAAISMPTYRVPGYSMRPFFACNASSIVLKSFHCSLQLDQLGTSRRKNFSEQSSRISSRQGVPSFVLPDFLQIQNSQRCRMILFPQGASALCTIDLPAFASAILADSFSTAHVKTSLAPGCTLTF